MYSSKQFHDQGKTSSIARSQKSSVVTGSPSKNQVNRSQVIMLFSDSIWVKPEDHSADSLLLFSLAIFHSFAIAKFFNQKNKNNQIIKYIRYFIMFLINKKR
jgi:hypothetical protein